MKKKKKEQKISAVGLLIPDDSLSGNLNGNLSGNLNVNKGLLEAAENVESKNKKEP